MIGAGHSILVGNFNLVFIKKTVYFIVVKKIEDIYDLNIFEDINIYIQKKKKENERFVYWDEKKTINESWIISNSTFENGHNDWKDFWMNAYLVIISKRVIQDGIWGILTCRGVIWILWETLIITGLKNSIVSKRKKVLYSKIKITIICILWEEK